MHLLQGMHRANPFTLQTIECMALLKAMLLFALGLAEQPDEKLAKICTADSPTGLWQQVEDIV